MTESEMNRIAEMVVDKIIARQKAYDEEFKAEIQGMVDDDAEIEFGTITEDEIIAEELIKLNNRLAQLEDNEDYEAAGIVANKIKHLKNKYNL
jgi:protein-arginine kinase activator protein McsA|tara:strand:- start:185 stop:463 length:279 start_codon:yes stop_codon:yes gene_type:complete